MICRHRIEGLKSLVTVIDFGGSNLFSSCFIGLLGCACPSQGGIVGSCSCLLLKAGGEYGQVLCWAEVRARDFANRSTAAAVEEFALGLQLLKELELVRWTDCLHLGQSRR